MTANPCTPKPYEPTAIEKATAAIMNDLGQSITHQYIIHRVREQIGEEEKFRRILAGYFERKTLREWADDLGVLPPDGSNM